MRYVHGQITKGTAHLLSMDLGKGCLMFRGDHQGFDHGRPS